MICGPGILQRPIPSNVGVLGQPVRKESLIGRVQHSTPSSTWCSVLGKGRSGGSWDAADCNNIM